MVMSEEGKLQYGDMNAVLRFVENLHPDGDDEEDILDKRLSTLAYALVGMAIGNEIEIEMFFGKLEEIYGIVLEDLEKGRIVAIEQGHAPGLDG